MTNILFYSLSEFFWGFVYAIFIVLPLQAFMAVTGIFSEFDIDVTIKVCAILSFANLLIIWYSVPLEIEEGDEEE